MKLNEIEKPTITISRAIQDGIHTAEEYQYWISGYNAGKKDMQDRMTLAIKEDDAPIGANPFMEGR